jgi:hypothetical protein
MWKTGVHVQPQIQGFSSIGPINLEYSPKYGDFPKHGSSILSWDQHPRLQPFPSLVSSIYLQPSKDLHFFWWNQRKCASHTVRYRGAFGALHSLCGIPALALAQAPGHANDEATWDNGHLIINKVPAHLVFGILLISHIILTFNEFFFAILSGILNSTWQNFYTYLWHSIRRIFLPRAQHTKTQTQTDTDTRTHTFWQRFWHFKSNVFFWHVFKFIKLAYYI